MRLAAWSARSDARPIPRAGGRDGFTLIETLVALSLAAIVLLTASVAAIRSYGAYRSANLTSSTETRLRQAVRRAAWELMSSSLSVLQPQNIDDDFGTSDLVFQQATGVDVANSRPLWGPPVRLVLEYDRGEADDGVDNDGDGLVDEGVLVLIRDDGGPNEIRTVLCHDVPELGEGETLNNADDNGNGVRDEAGFNVHREGDIVTLRLSVEENDQQGGTAIRTLSATIQMRN